MATPITGMKIIRIFCGACGRWPKGFSPKSAAAPTERREPSSIGKGRCSTFASIPPAPPMT
jgi:hypothetical protein